MGQCICRFDPACFSIVMATGIVAIACRQQSGESIVALWISVTLLGINLCIFAILLTMLVLCLARHHHRLVTDISDHQQAFGFFSIIAACCVLGSGLLHISGNSTSVRGLWWAGLTAWFIITYSVMTGITTAKNKPAICDSLHGGWLLTVVATQSVAILAIPLCDKLLLGRDATLLLSLAFFLVGGMLYVINISLIFYRYCFEPMSTDSMAPPYWINMGAMAISTVAGAALLGRATQGSVLLQFAPFIKGATFLYWAVATWWIPLLIVLGFWRHVRWRVPFSYDTRYWSMVFPLGMYSVATHEMHLWLELDLFKTLAVWFACASLVAWIATSIGLARRCKTLVQSAAGPDSCEAFR